MAVAFQAVSALSFEDDNTGTTVSVDFPSNVEGDFLLACVGVSNAGTGTAVAMLDETGWTRFTANSWTSATAGATTFYYRFAPAGGISNQVFDAAATTGYVACGMVFTGVDPTTPIDVGPLFTNNQASGTSVDAPSYTTVTDGAMGIVSMNRDGAPVAITEPAGYTNIIDQGNAGPGDGVICNVSYQIHATAGLQNPAAFTWGTAQESCAMSFALRPAPEGGAYDQTSFRGVNDDGSESASTFKAAVNTNFNQPQDENFRIRFLIQEDDDVEDLDMTFQLQYNLNAQGWNNVDGASSVVRSAASTFFADGDTTTQRIGAGTFIGTNNGMDETEGLAGGAGMDFTTTINQETEVEFCCQIRSADTVSGDTIQLRVINDKTSQPFATYTNTPTLTIPTGAGMMLASAEFLAGAAAVQNPGTFDFQRSLPWGAITLALRVDTGSAGAGLAPTSKFSTINSTGVVTVADGATVDGLTFNCDVILEDVVNLTDVTINGDLTIQTRGTYSFVGVTVTGDIINTDSGVGSNVTINATGGSVLSTTEPGTGDGLVNIVQAVNITLTDVIADSEVRLFLGTQANAAAATEIDGVESSGTSVTLTHNNVGQAAYIVVHKENYVTKYFVFASLSGTDTSIPAGQQFDTGYVNP